MTPTAAAGAIITAMGISDPEETWDKVERLLVDSGTVLFPVIFSRSDIGENVTLKSERTA